MESAAHATPSPARPSRFARGLVAVAIGLLAVPGLAGCGAAHESARAWTTMTPTASPMDVTTPAPAADDAAAMDAVWAARPAYVRADARTEEAYAFALRSPGLLKWMPCYCGCGGMGHRSNLDCYFKPTMAGLAPRYEEHASYCATCVDTTLMAKRMLAAGSSLSQVRAAIDQTFGGAVPGTPTELPPA
jgi:hypothetical protein